MRCNPARSARSWPVGVAPVALAALLASGCATGRRAERGDALAHEERWDEAIAAYEEAAAGRPEDAVLAGKLEGARRAAAAHQHVAGRKAEADGDLRGALAAYDRALTLQPSNQAARTDGSKVRRLLRIVGRNVVQAEARLARGDCLGAKADLEGLLAYVKAFPEVEAGRVGSLKVCFGQALAAARVYFDLGAIPLGEAMLDEAESYFPGHAEVARLRAEAGGVRAAGEFVAQGHAALVDGELAEAAEAYRAALARDPSRTDAREGLTAATARLAGQQIQGLGRQNRSGRWQEMLAALEAALASGLEDEVVRSRLETLAIDLRKRAAARLYRRGERADAGGLFGAAWVWFRLATLVGKTMGDADLKARVAVARIEQVVPYRILVVPPDNPSVHGGLGAEIAWGLMAALEGDLVGSRVTLTSDPNVQPPPDGILRGKLTNVSLPVPEVQEGSRPVVWQPPDSVRTNAEVGQALASYAQAAASGDATAKAGALRVLQATPPTVHETPPAVQLQVPVVTVRRSTALGAELELYDRANDKVVTAAFADAQCMVEDDGVLPVPAADLAGDPVELPGTPAIRRRLVADLVDDLRDQVGPALGMAGLRFQRLADRVRGDARLHYLVLALVAGSPDAEALSQELLQATGYVYGPDRYDAAHLPR